MTQQRTLSRYATTIRHEGLKTIIRFHNTNIVEFTPTKILLRTNGWETPTTKTRMNQATNQFNLEYNVFQKDYTWYVLYGNKIIKYENEMTLKRGIKP